jgi:acyl carrier protein
VFLRSEGILPVWHRPVNQLDRITSLCKIAERNELIGCDLALYYLKEEDHMSDEVFDTIKKIITELLDIDEGEIALESRFREDLEADSLDLVELIMEFEERFGGEISDEDAQKITTVGEAVEYVKTRM